MKRENRSLSFLITRNNRIILKFLFFIKYKNIVLGFMTP